MSLRTLRPAFAPIVTSLRLACAASLGFVLANTAWAAVTPGISVEIQDIVQLPNTQSATPEDDRVDDGLTRINFMQELHDGSGRWMVNDLRGQVYMVDSNTNTVLPDLYLDFNTEFSRFIHGPAGLSTGLINVTPDPDFANNGKFYSIHEEAVSSRGPQPDFVAQGNPGNIANGQQAVILEWTATDPTANVFSGTSRELMRIAQPAGNLHSAGDILFSPLDGLMYIAMGDQGYDSEGRGSPQVQRLDSIFGKIVRIDPDGNNSANGAYGIPTDNPFYDGAGTNVDEIWALGFRNPHRLQFDPVTELLTTTDIGQGFAEEINILRAGENYGWGPDSSWYEGTFHRGGSAIVGPVPSEYTFPGAQYLHSDLPAAYDAIAGGFVYRGSLIPELYGKFIYGDIVSGELLYSDFDEIIAADAAQDLSTAEVFSLSLTQNGVPVTLQDLIIDARGLGETTLPNFNRHDIRFGQTADGEIYVMSKYDGFIRQLGAIPEPSTALLCCVTSMLLALRRRRS